MLRNFADVDVQIGSTTVPEAYSFVASSDDVFAGTRVELDNSLGVFDRTSFADEGQLAVSGPCPYSDFLRNSLVN